MIHLGDITKISGYDVPPVDCIIGGSPCQDLSLAGSRAGLSGKRSGLFVHQIRIVKEMRDADRRLRGRTGQFVRPRFMVWENVPGAFSSNKGADFKAVLEETIRIADPEAPDIPLPPKGKWPLADTYYGDGWSIAYRVCDSQFWGVAQRRRRIALVADFGGRTAPEILFERKSLSWDSPESAETGKAAASGTGEGAAATNSAGGLIVLNDQGGQIMDVTIDKTGTLRAQEHGHQPIVLDPRGCGDGENVPTPPTSSDATENNAPVVTCAGFNYSMGAKAGNIGYQDETSVTLGTYNNAAVFYLHENDVDSDANQGGNGDGEDIPTIPNGHENQATDYTTLVMATGQANAEILHDLSPTLISGHERPIVAVPLYENSSYQDVTGTLCANSHPGGVTGQDAYNDMLIVQSVAAVDCRHGTENPEINGTLQSKASGGQSLNLNNVVRQEGTVRRLTPLECERLQGFPDGWTDIGDWTDEQGKVHKTSDAVRYKALGNSIALPPWKFILKRLCAIYERDATMGSLFDGIGGFPKIWEQLNGEGSCLWASEIEPFCVAVTKKRFCHKEGETSNKKKKNHESI